MSSPVEPAQSVDRPSGVAAGRLTGELRAQIVAVLALSGRCSQSERRVGVGAYVTGTDGQLGAKLGAQPHASLSASHLAANTHFRVTGDSDDCLLHPWPRISAVAEGAPGPVGDNFQFVGWEKRSPPKNKGSTVKPMVRELPTLSFLFLAATSSGPPQKTRQRVIKK